MIPASGRRLGAAEQRQLNIWRLAHHPKGGVSMPVRLTFHMFGYTVTIKVKKDNRHTAR